MYVATKEAGANFVATSLPSPPPPLIPSTPTDCRNFGADFHQIRPSNMNVPSTLTRAVSQCFTQFLKLASIEFHFIFVRFSSGECLDHCLQEPITIDQVVLDMETLFIVGAQFSPSASSSSQLIEFVSCVDDFALQ